MLAPEAERALREAEEIAVVTRGRRTGLERRAKVWFVYDAGAAWIATQRRVHGRGTDWYRNLAATGECVLEVEGHTFRGRLERIDDEAGTLRRVIAMLREKYGKEWVSDWWVDLPRIPVRIRIEA